MYRQAIIGVLWALIIPLVSLATFILLNASGVFNVGAISVPYPIYALLGLLLWQVFATILIATTSSLVNAGAMVRKINFSKKALVLASAGQSLVPFIIQVVLLSALFLYYRVTPSVYTLLIPIVVVPVILLSLGLGFLLSLANAVARDVGSMVSILMGFLLFLTPILYLKPSTGILAKIADINPLYYLVSSARDVLLKGTTSEWMGWVVSCLLSLAVFMFGLVVFHLTEVRVAERV